MKKIVYLDSLDRFRAIMEAWITSNFNNLYENDEEQEKAIKEKVSRNDLSYRILLQLCAYYLVPEWTYKEGGYKKDEVVRCQGRMFQALRDNTTSPYIAVDDGNGNIVVDDNWNILTTDKVDEENWAHVLGGAPEFNLIQQIANLREENLALIESLREENRALKEELSGRIELIEQFMRSRTFITTE